MLCSGVTSKAWTPCGISWTPPYTRRTLLARAPPLESPASTAMRQIIRLMTVLLLRWHHQHASHESEEDTSLLPAHKSGAVPPTAQTGTSACASHGTGVTAPTQGLARTATLVPSAVPWNTRPRTAARRPQTPHTANRAARRN